MANAMMVCPGCLQRTSHVAETVEASRLAEVWHTHWPVVPAPEVAIVRGWLEADLRSRTIRFHRCSRCGLEFSDPMRSWSAQHYPAQSHGLGFDQQEALER